MKTLVLREKKVISRHLSQHDIQLAERRKKQKEALKTWPKTIELKKRESCNSRVWSTSFFLSIFSALCVSYFVNACA